MIIKLIVIVVLVEAVEKWSKVLNEKMDAWIREQKAFQERLLELEEERSQPFWSRWGRK